MKITNHTAILMFNSSSIQEKQVASFIMYCGYILKWCTLRHTSGYTRLLVNDTPPAYALKQVGMY